MGWLWSSPTPSSSSPSQENKSSIASSFTEDSSAAPSSTSSRSPTLTPDELAEKELQSFLQELEADARPSSTKYNRVTRGPPSRISAASNGSNNAEEEEPLSEQLLPKTMSCRAAFDSAFYCNSFGGQFNNLYRYGTVRSCSQNWNDFWFCMRTRSYGPKEKEEMIKQRYRERDRLRYGKGEVGTSSEDVWTSRDRKVEWGEAFNVPVPEFEGDDEEWNRMERARRAGKVDGSLG